MRHRTLRNSVWAVCGVLITASLVSSGCSTAEKIPEYRGDRISPPIEVPPDLDKPVINERMKIPELPSKGDSSSGDDEAEPETSDARSIEKPPVFIEEE